MLAYELCAICGRVTGRAGNAICATCASELEGVDLPTCGVCNKPCFPDDLADYLGCDLCLPTMEGYDACYP